LYYIEFIAVKKKYRSNLGIHIVYIIYYVGTCVYAFKQNHFFYYLKISMYVYICYIDGKNVEF